MCHVCQDSEKQNVLRICPNVVVVWTGSCKCVNSVVSSISNSNTGIVSLVVSETE